MNYSQIDVSSLPATETEGPAAVPVPQQPELIQLLTQMLDVQREQLNFQRAAAAAHDAMGRWRSFLSRWHEEFPALSNGCRNSLPYLERCYAKMINEMNERVEEENGLENDFALQEFLDRYGMRLAQLGTILNLVGPLAEAGPQNEPAA